jgi:RimJ/RimL family protein N-acetyltransferase
VSADPPPGITPALPPHAAVTLDEWRTLPDAARDAVRDLRISAEQHEFAGTIARSIAACEAGDPADVAGLAIRADGEVVGWLLLKRGAAAPDWVDADAAVLSGLRIDARCQGRGLGSLALAQLARWVADCWPDTARLMLRVDEGNVAGIRAYENAGWREVGERRIGRVGPERTLALAL